MVKTISIEELKELMNSDDKFTLIDVREEDELSHGMIPGAVNVPVGEIEEAFTKSKTSPEEFKEKYEFDRPEWNDDVVCYCRTGGRSLKAVEVLMDLSFINAKNYGGSVFEWSKTDDDVEFY